MRTEVGRSATGAGERRNQPARNSCSSSVAAATLQPVDRARRRDHDQAAVRLRFQGKELTFPAFVEPLLQYIAEQAEFRVSSLPDQLTDESKLVLVRRLIREGFLWPARS